MHTQVFTTPDLSMPDSNKQYSPVRQFNISRGPLKPGYHVFLDDERRSFYAEMNFEMDINRKSYHKLTLRNLEEGSCDIAVPYMPWASSRHIYIGFRNSDKIPEIYWEELYWEEMKKE